MWGVRAALIIIMALVIGIFGFFQFGLPSYSWHQKVTIEVEADGEVYSGYSVVRVRWRKNSSWGALNGPAWIKSIKGEAPFVEIPGRGIVFALLNPPDNSSYTNGLAFRVLGNDVKGLTVDGKYKALKVILGTPLAVSPKFYPFLVWFTDLHDPASARQINPSKLAKSLGSGARLQRITLQITDAPVTTGRVKRVLPWMGDPTIFENPVWSNLPSLGKRAILGLKSPTGAS